MSIFIPVLESLLVQKLFCKRLKPEFEQFMRRFRWRGAGLAV
jgi:hypothetical protein